MNRRHRHLQVRFSFIRLLAALILANSFLVVFFLDAPPSVEQPFVIFQWQAESLHSHSNQAAGNGATSPRKKKWEKTQQWLCPNQSLNLTAAVQTFRRAQEIGLSSLGPAEEPSAVINTPTGTIRKFFLHWPGHVSIRDKSTNRIATFLRTYKCGSITLRDYFERVLKPASENYDSFHTSLYYRGFVRTNLGESSSCICTTFRDPIDHFFSGLQELEMRRNTNPWKKKVTKLAPYEKLELISKERFFAFVDYLLSGEWIDIYKYHDGFFDFDFGHVLPQSSYLHYLQKKHGRDISSFVDMYSIAETIPSVLNETCGFKRETIPPVIEKKTHKKLPGMSSLHKSIWANATTSSGNSLGQDYELFYYKLEALCLLHAVDYACLANVLKDPLPKICEIAFEKYL